MADWKRLSALARTALIDGQPLSPDELAEALHEVAEGLHEASWQERGGSGELMFEAHLLLWALGQAIAADGIAEMGLDLKRHRKGGRPKSLQRELVYGGAAARVERYMKSGWKQEAAKAQVLEDFAGANLSERTLERKLAELRAKTSKVSAPSS